DPRYPEVRNYLIHIYVNALKTWKVDGFKLDFIDDFKVYPETDLSKANGRDYASVNQAVERLLRDVYESLQAIQPNILIEFRQKYIGPALRSFGNMFRAFDCPNDSLTNRIRTTDVKLLCGQTAVHSDMFTWHYDEPVELAALQVVNILFSVPQISVRLGEVSEECLQMLHFYTHYWRSHREILLDGEFQAYRPSSNYPLLKSKNGQKIIYGIYDETIVELDNNCAQLDLINGKRSQQIVLQVGQSLGKCQLKVYNCCGQEQSDQWIDLNSGLHVLDVPAAGLCQIQSQD
ncbi:MAG: alpha-galactosidase, partial [Bacteroidota bacterium]